jgi:hypothetical protein
MINYHYAYTNNNVRRRSNDFISIQAVHSQDNTIIAHAITYNLYYGAKGLVLRPLSKTINQEIGPIPTNA